jgi:hypothetical protein
MLDTKGLLISECYITAVKKSRQCQDDQQESVKFIDPLELRIRAPSTTRVAALFVLSWCSLVALWFIRVGAGILIACRAYQIGQRARPTQTDRVCHAPAT